MGEQFMLEDIDAELGYEIVNPDAPPDEPKLFRAPDREFQRRAEKTLREWSDEWRSEGK